ncbi:conserved hypothetical protein [Verticillium alfalfae VaMs.102]|uniref:Endoplasmic reticulum protein n=1 Tax=Verticillium alfalfae (strain VaMs.102 / ATCC MYA-4576 / FGSC 10136) TaxID=526221 RepID=C9S722_VERA1|nr:conserved hypothetical protein [Verticillium alfalfae VaMs.102]EEY15199.1 conserved hypothetical protein [Verticillium alfalfae VaMs.102]
MAPPPSADLPLQQRLLQLAQTLQFGWFAGHAVLILCTIRYGFSWIRLNYYSGMAQFSYRTAFVAAAVTYGIVVYKTWRARARSGAKNLQNPITILSDENVQYLDRAFVKQYYDFSHVPSSASLSSPCGSRVLLSAILFQRRSWILIVIYTAFLRARFAQSSHIQNSVSELEARVDSAVGNQGTPPQARQVWEAVKNGVRQFYNLTDANRYLSGAAAPKKTS